MSNVGQAALIIVGTVVGAYAGYPQLGFVMGSLAGSALFPTQLPPGPRLTDTRTTTSAVGGPVAIVFGTAALAGTVMDLGPVVEIDNKGGKGGPVQETFTYTQTIAIGLCERVDDEADDSVGAIGGLSRIWENGAIVYDIRPQLQADTATGQAAETDAQYANRLAASAAYAETFTLYLGDEEQLADPTLQALHGVDQTPAFRGLAYIVYPNRQLNVAQGLRHPNFQFEVFQAGTGECTDSTEYSGGVILPWSESARDPRTLGAVYSYRYTYADGTDGFPVRTTFEAAVADAKDDFGNPIVLEPTINGFSFFIGETSNIWPDGDPAFRDPPSQPNESADIPNALSLPLYMNRYSWSQRITTTLDLRTGTGNLCDALKGVMDGAGPAYWTATLIDIHGVQGHESHGVYYFPSRGSTGEGNFGCSDLSQVFNTPDNAIILTRLLQAPLDPCFSLPPSPISGFCIRDDGKLIKGGPWTPTSGNFHVLQTPGAGNPITKYPLDPCLPDSDPNYDDATFWTAAYNAAVLAGSMPAGKVFNVDYPVFLANAYTIDLVVCEGSGAQASLADIISMVCKRSGLQANQIDVKDLAEVFVDGYAIAQVCTGASIITPLRSIGFFDYVETGGLAKFATRGKPIVATLTTDDFGCYDASQGIDGQDNVDSTGASNCPPSITTVRAQPEDLPRSIRFHYSAVSRDYEDGEQDSNFRLATPATNDVDVTVPLSLGDTQALQCASVLWADAWQAQSSFELTVDQAWTILDVGDCIGVPVDGFIRRMRIANDTNSGVVLRKLSCVQDGEGAYISFAVAEPPQRQPSRLTFISPTTYELLDLPALQDADSDAGFYVAAQPSGTTGNQWNGAQMYKSVDGGLTFAAVFGLFVATPVGTIDTAIPPSEFFTWDDYTVITVNLASSAYSFESVSDDAVLAGQNAAAMGFDGRWEIVQFANAEQISPTQWQLSRLLRGRRGTEHVLGSSEVGDTFVMLSSGSLGRMPLDSTQIGALENYDGVSIGASFATGTITPFTGHAMALMPFNPVDARAFDIAGGDIEISWTRRDRLGRTLMSGVDMPLSEATLAFQVDILEPGSPHTALVVVRTIATTSVSCVYTRAQQEADFGSPAPTTLRIAIYQMSAIVGRGIPLLAELTIGSSP